MIPYFVLVISFNFSLFLSAGQASLFLPNPISNTIKQTLSSYSKQSEAIEKFSKMWQSVVGLLAPKDLHSERIAKIRALRQALNSYSTESELSKNYRSRQELLEELSTLVESSELAEEEEAKQNSISTDKNEFTSPTDKVFRIVPGVWQVGGCSSKEATHTKGSSTQATQEETGNWNDKTKAEQWDLFNGEDGLGDDNRRYQSDIVVRNWLRGHVSGKTVLDYGCGNGYWARRLENAQASKVIGADFKPFVEIGERYSQRERHVAIEYRELGPGDTLPVESNTVDIVLSNYVIMDVENLTDYVQNMYRVLKFGGKAIVVLLHPCFSQEHRKEVEGTLTTAWPRSYFMRHRQEIPAFHEIFTDSFLVHHRSLELYAQAFYDAGFSIEEIEEPHLTETQKQVLNPELVKKLTHPISIAFLLKKSGARPGLRAELLPYIQTQAQESLQSAKALEAKNVAAVIWERSASIAVSSNDQKALYLSGKGAGWRLPTIWELFALYVHRAELGDTLYGGYYWSSTKYKNGTSYWVLNFDNGDVCSSQHGKAKTISLRAVRDIPRETAEGEQPKPREEG